MSYSLGRKMTTFGMASMVPPASICTMLSMILVFWLCEGPFCFSISYVFFYSLGVDSGLHLHGVGTG